MRGRSCSPRWRGGWRFQDFVPPPAPDHSATRRVAPPRGILVGERGEFVPRTLSTHATPALSPCHPGDGDTDTPDKISGLAAHAWRWDWSSYQRSRQISRYLRAQMARGVVARDTVLRV